MAYVVSATWRARDGEEERIRELLETVAPLCRAEPACRLYEAHRSTEDPRDFYIYEQYDDEAEFLAHARPTTSPRTSWVRRLKAGSP